MGEINIRILAKELNLSIGTVSKALRDSYEISAETKERVQALAHKFDYTANPYASSLRRKKSDTIAVVVPEVADSFFSLAIKGIEEVAQTKGYHVLIYLTYENYEKEKKVLEDFKNGRVDGVLMSVSSETFSTSHIHALNVTKLPLVFFDRVIDEIEAAKVRTNDLESGYKATLHLIEQGCKKIAYLSISSHLEIDNKRLAGYKKALEDNNLEATNKLIPCVNDFTGNHDVLFETMKQKNRPDGIIASVEKLVTPFYLVCKEIGIKVPDEVKVVSFANLATAQILNPSLTTITQPAFEIGKAAATILFKALEKRNYDWKKENIIIPSELYIRESSVHKGYGSIS